MPIHLPPLSRRTFLVRAAVLSAGLLVAPSVLAARKKKIDANLWALLSDTHIAGDRATVTRTVNMATHLEAVAGQVNALERRPGGVIISGDLAFNRGEPTDYQAFQDLLRLLREGGQTVHLTLGNHDHRENFYGALKLKPGKPAEGRQVALVKSSLANWFLLDSLEATNSTPGMLGAGQLAWLTKELDRNRSKPAIIVVHHNPGAKENIAGLKDTDALFEIIRPRKQVKAWVFGHTHHWSIEKDTSGIHMVNLPPTAYVFKDGDPSGWVLGTLCRDGIRLEMRTLDLKHPANGQIRDLQWREV